MAKTKLELTFDTKQVTEEVSQLINLLKEADRLIDSISSRGFKNLVVAPDTHRQQLQAFHPMI